MNLLEEARRIPGRYWVLALTLSAVLWSFLSGVWIPLDTRAGIEGFIEEARRGANPLTVVIVIMAPFIALRWVPLAAAMAMVPGVVQILQHGVLESADLCLPIAVAMVATWQVGWRSLVVLLPALMFVGFALSGEVDLIAPDAARNDFNHHNSDVGYLVTTFLLFVVPMVVAVAAAMALRASVRSAQREAVLVARSAEVEADAAVVGERARLARDLHDVVAHHVSLIAVRAETAPFSEPGMSDSSKTVLSDIADDARAALDELRGVLGILRRSDGESPDREPLPGLADIAGLVDRARRAGDDVTLNQEPAEASGTSGYVAYRIVQEALTNARKHAAGQPVTVAIMPTAGGLRVEVANPLGSAEIGPTRGIAGMRERVEAIGGRFVAGPHVSQFVIDVLLPLKGTAA